MEPERPIEKLLRAFAKKRRDEAGAPLELHPATRRMLQGEVTRKFGKGGAAPKQSFLQDIVRSWPRMAWGFAVVGLVGLMAALILPALNKTKTLGTLAKNNESMPAPSSESLNAPTPSAAPAGDVSEINGVSGQTQLADKNASLFDAEKESVRKKEQAAGEKDSLLSPAESKVAEMPLTLAAQSRDESRSHELAKTPALDGISSPGSDRAGGAPVRRSAVTSPNLSSASQPQIATASPTAIGSSLASRSLANTPLSADTQPPTSGGLPPQPGFAGGPIKQLKEESDPLAKSAPAPAPSAPLSLETAAAENRYRYYADDAKKDVPNSQRFAQVIPSENTKAKSSSKLSPAQKLLVSFQVEQNGRDLKILDDDGSVYSGYLQITNAITRLPDAAAQKPSQETFYRQRTTEAELRQPPVQNLIFRVAGTNRSLKQNVIFTGTLLETTNIVFLGALSNSLNAAKSFGAQNFSLQNGDLGTLQLLNTTISGKAQVGNQKEIEIKAIPVTR